VHDKDNAKRMDIARQVGTQKSTPPTYDARKRQM
jgi:hypothetical protein